MSDVSKTSGARILLSCLLLSFILVGCGRKASFVHDDAGILTNDEKSRIEEMDAALLRDVGINIIVATVKESPDNIDIASAEMFGDYVPETRKGDSNAVLFLIDPTGKQVRVEVGYGLEHIFTDGFVGYIERRQMVPFFKSGKVGSGIEATVELMVSKAMGRIDEQTESLYETGEYLSGGGGASTDADIGSGAVPKDIVSSPAEFAAQPTPELALEAYRKSLVCTSRTRTSGCSLPRRGSSSASGR